MSFATTKSRWVGTAFPLISVERVRAPDMSILLGGWDRSAKVWSLIGMVVGNGANCPAFGGLSFPFALLGLGVDVSVICCFCVLVFRGGISSVFGDCSMIMLS